MTSPNQSSVSDPLLLESDPLDFIAFFWFKCAGLSLTSSGTPLSLVARWGPTYKFPPGILLWVLKSDNLGTNLRILGFFKPIAWPFFFDVCMIAFQDRALLFPK